VTPSLIDRELIPLPYVAGVMASRLHQHKLNELALRRHPFPAAGMIGSRAEGATLAARALVGRESPFFFFSGLRPEIRAETSTLNGASSASPSAWVVRFLLALLSSTADGQSDLIEILC